MSGPRPPLRVSVVIPVFNEERRIDRCLAALAKSAEPPGEVIVVSDGSTDRTVQVASQWGVRILELARQQGPARARNLGAAQATGDILLFLDSDVYARPDTISVARDRLERDADLAALVGAYDLEPPESNFLSQYKNLTHSYVHRTARPDGTTFWTGCGAVRRHIFLALGGFDESFRRSSIEDIEFGSRLHRAGGKIRFDPALAATHAKRWNWLSLLRTDIFDRAIPWTELILRGGSLSDNLNLKRSQRFSVGLAWFGMLAAAFALIASGTDRGIAGGIAAASLLGLGLLNGGYYRFLRQHRGLLFAVRAFPMQVLFYLYGGAAFLAGAVCHLSGSRGVKPVETVLPGEQ